MGQSGEFYSQFVGFLKITLPLAALALMSMVFLVARAPTTDSDIPYAEIEDIARDARLSGAEVSGVADDGTVFEISAREARPNGDILSATTLFATLTNDTGTRVNMRAGSGEIDNAAQTARLSGLTRLETSNGYQMETAGVTADLTTGRVVSDGALEVHTPYGTLSAGQLIIETPEGSTSQQLIFQNGVRLVYTPQQ